MWCPEVDDATREAVPRVQRASKLGSRKGWGSADLNCRPWLAGVLKAGFYMRPGLRLIKTLQSWWVSRFFLFMEWSLNGDSEMTTTVTLFSLFAWSFTYHGLKGE